MSSGAPPSTDRRRRAPGPGAEPDLPGLERTEAVVALAAGIAAGVGQPRGLRARLGRRGVGLGGPRLAPQPRGCRRRAPSPTTGAPPASSPSASWRSGAYVGVEAVRSLVAGERPDTSAVGVVLATSRCRDAVPRPGQAARRPGARLAGPGRGGGPDGPVRVLSGVLLVGLRPTRRSAGGGPTASPPSASPHWPCEAADHVAGRVARRHVLPLTATGWCTASRCRSDRELLAEQDDEEQGHRQAAIVAPAAVPAW